MKKLLILCLTFHFFICAGGDLPPATIHVSPDGKADKIGTSASPLDLVTGLSRARATPGGDTIELAAGDYYDVHLSFTVADRGLVIRNSGNGTATFYGGSPVNTWHAEGKWLYTKVPGSGDRSHDFRSLIINTASRDRARIPTTGALTHESIFDVKWLSSSAGGWARKPTDEETNTLKYRAGDLPADLDINNAELTIYHEWDESHVGLKAIDPTTRRLTFSNPSSHPPGAFAARNPNAQTYVVWNTREGMTRPGQWFLDRTRERLYYWPLPGETADNITAVLPRHQTILTFEEGANEIGLYNVKLSAAASEMVTGGYGARNISAAVKGEDVQNLTFRKVDITNVDGWGFRFTKASNIRILDCEVGHIGAGAIDYKGDHFSITDNYFHDLGKNYFSAVGLFGDGENNTVSHNEFFNMPYCGINGVGDHSKVENNIIHQIKTFMQDGGAIYMFAAKNTEVRGNVVLNDRSTKVKTYAYYLDERSDSCLVEGNLALNTRVPVQAHMSLNATYRNNVFLDQGDMDIPHANSVNLQFEHNVLVANKIHFKGPSKDSRNQQLEDSIGEVMARFSAANGITSWKNNVFYSRTSTIQLSELIQYSTFKKGSLSERDGTIFGDPKILGLAKGKVNFSDDSPASANGIKALDFSIVGPRNDLGNELAELIQRYYPL